MAGSAFLLPHCIRNQAVSLLDLKTLVWLKGHEVLGRDPSLWRYDDNWTLIHWHEHGNRNSDYGWEIDHIVAKALGGSDDLANLRPLHWRANCSHGGLLANALMRT